MKKLIVGLFSNRDDAEKLITKLHSEHNLSSSEISYIYKNKDGITKEVDTDEIATDKTDTASEGAVEGATIGGSIGALAGIAVAMGILPVLGPIFVAGPLVTALGFGTGAVATTAAGALTGAAAGGIIGALVNMGTDEAAAKKYEEQISAGNILVSVHSENDTAVVSAMEDCGGYDINVYTLKV